MTQTGRIAVFLIVIGAVAAVAAVAADVPRVIQAVRTKAAPDIDGRLDDACWKEAQEITDFQHYRTPDLALLQTYGYVCYDDSHLYVGMKCLIPQGTKPAGGMLDHDDDAIFGAKDLVEIMLDPGRTQNEYYQLVINAYGATFDTSRSVGGTGYDEAWDGDWKGKSTIGDGYWSAELAVPYHNLGITPEVGSTWGINLCREDGDGEIFSSIGVDGDFNVSEKFAVLEDLDVDFGKYFFGIDPGVVVYEPTPETPGPVLNMRLTNMTGKKRTVRIDVHSAAENGEMTVESNVSTFSKEQSVLLPLEMLEIDPLGMVRAGLSSTRVEPRTKKIVVTDPETDTILALSVVRKQLTWMYKAMRLSVDDAWPKLVAPAKDVDISVAVHIDLPKQHREKGVLAVTLTSRSTGEAVITEAFHAPAKTTEMSIRSGQLPWDAYDVRVAFADESGSELAESKALAVVLPTGKQRIRRLNNVTCDLVSSNQPGPGDQSEIEFMNPRDGWCLFRVSGDAAVTLDNAEQPLAAEVMRLLPAGRHSLRIDGGSEELVVRSIPELFSHELTGAPREQINMPPNDFIDQFVIPHVNTFAIGADHVTHPLLQKWQPEGRRFFHCTLLPHFRATKPLNVEDIVEFISGTTGFADPVCSGTIGDEFLNSEPINIIYTDALRRVVALPEFRNKQFYAYASHLYGAPEGRELVQAFVDTGSSIAWKRYLVTQPDERSARKFLHEELVLKARQYRELCPGSLEQITVCFGYYSAPARAMMQSRPWIHYKTYLDMQLNIVANDPAFLGTKGLMSYHSSYADEEIIRWMPQLFRHYGIEGKTERFTDAPYESPHLANGDFIDAMDGWSVEPAEKDSIRPVIRMGFGALQERVAGTGDTVLVMERSAKQPNVVTQEIKGLQPGNLYAFRMFSGDFEDMSREEKHAVNIELQNVDMIPDGSYTPVLRYQFGVTALSEKTNFWMNYYSLIFRAKDTTAKLTISDWVNEQEPGGPIGQQLMFNFVQVHPYYSIDE
ncbi:MAG: carbohydrate binding family 9 domain-containing protein [Lentisphaeria bacterium]